MVITHNMTAMNANRTLGIVTDRRKKSTEKLSSGYKINRAADDAAGLTISEKLRSQIRGLTQASANCQDGVSLCQIADGALNETHSMLQRMNELAVKSANGTNTDADRAAIQAEIEQLSGEFDRIATSTSYNAEIYPLNKGIGDITPERVIASDSGQKWLIPSNLVDKTVTISRWVWKDCTYNGTAIAINQPATMTGLALSDTIPSNSNNIVVNGANLVYDGSSEFQDKDMKSLSVSDLKVDNQGYIYYTCGDESMYLMTRHFTYPDKHVQYYAAATSSKMHETGVKKSGDSILQFEYMKAVQIEGEVTSEEASKAGYKNNTSVSIQAGARNKDEQRIPIHFVDATKRGLQLTDPEIDVSTIDGAREAIDRVKNAINIVSEYRSYFGATQNRLEHTIANLDNIVENTQQAESRIRDTDMASEMVDFSKQNILLQAGTSMLSQANQATQGVLSLLQ